MAPRAKARASRPRVNAPSGERPRHWLLLVHVLPPTPSNLRVRTWRRLQQLGSIAVKQSVYALPDSPAAREDFEWLKTEIEGSGGQAAIFTADGIDAWTDDALVEEFRRSRQSAYAGLTHDVERSLRLVARRSRPRDVSGLRRRLEGFRQRLADIERIDFFGAAGRDRAAKLVSEIEARTAPSAGLIATSAAQAADDPQVFRKRTWVTRPRPGVDRMASAWLIRRFIDPDARFAFVPDLKAAPRQAVAFDMFGAEFSHRGDHCTFETLCERFHVRGAAVARVAAIVHDLDLKDRKFGAAETPTVGRLIEGLQLACEDDQVLLDRGMALFEGLYHSLARTDSTSAPPGRSTRHRRAPAAKRR